MYPFLAMQASMTAPSLRARSSAGRSAPVPDCITAVAASPLHCASVACWCIGSTGAPSVRVYALLLEAHPPNASAIAIRNALTTPSQTHHNTPPVLVKRGHTGHTWGYTYKIPHACKGLV